MPSKLTLWLNAILAQAKYAVVTKMRPADRRTPLPPVAQLIVLVNQSGWVSDAELAVYAAALETQLNRDVLSAYHAQLPSVAGFAVVVARPGVTPAPGAVVGYLTDTPDEHGDLGFHDPAGVFHVCASIIIMNGERLSVTLSHEAIETVLDPSTRKDAVSPDGLRVAYEACDPCRGEASAYLIGGVLVSDFVLPAYFGGGPGPYDQTGQVPKAFGLAPFGYLIYWNDATGWTTRFADRLPPRRPGSRSWRRMAAPPPYNA